MTDSKITDLTALTGANLADSDVFEVTDVSDTTMNASGTSKKITRAELVLGLPAVRNFATADASTAHGTGFEADEAFLTYALPTTLKAGDVLRLLVTWSLSTGSSAGGFYRVKIGSTTVWQIGVSNTDFSTSKWAALDMSILIRSTSDQVTQTWWRRSLSGQQNGGGLENSATGAGVATEDLTAGKNLVVSMLSSTSTAGAPTVVVKQAALLRHVS